MIEEGYSDGKPPSNEDKPPGQMCNIKEDNLFTGFRVLCISKWGDLFIRGEGIKSEYHAIPNISHVFHRVI